MTTRKAVIKDAKDDETRIFQLQNENSKNVIHDKNVLAWDSDDAVMGNGKRKVKVRHAGGCS